jgi:hypothetical protein
VPCTTYAGVGGLRGSVTEPWQIVDEGDAVEALRAWRESATTPALSRVLGVARVTVRRWMLLAGLYPQAEGRAHPRWPWRDAAEALASRVGASPEAVLRTAVRMRLAPASVLTPERVYAGPSAYVPMAEDREGAA